MLTIAFWIETKFPRIWEQLDCNKYMAGVSLNLTLVGKWAFRADEKKIMNWERTEEMDYKQPNPFLKKSLGKYGLLR